MKIKITTSKSLEIYSQLMQFVEKNFLMPAKTAWQISENIDSINNIVNRFNTMRDIELKALTELGVLSYENNTLVCNSDNVEYQKMFSTALTRLNEFLNIEHEININPICIEHITDNVTIKDMNALKIMFDSNDGESN